jgi:hypothetical protein
MLGLRTASERAGGVEYSLKMAMACHVGMQGIVVCRADMVSRDVGAGDQLRGEPREALDACNANLIYILPW